MLKKRNNKYSFTSIGGRCTSLNIFVGVSLSRPCMTINDATINVDSLIMMGITKPQSSTDYHL